MTADPPGRFWRYVALGAAILLLGVVPWGAAVVDARLTACPEIARGSQDGISMIGQGVSLWPVGPVCHEPARDVTYVEETAGWLKPVLLSLLILAIAVPGIAYAFAGRRASPVERRKTS